MKKLLVLAFASLIFFQTVKTAQAAEVAVAGNSAALVEQFTIQAQDERVEKLTAYLDFYRSPLVEYAPVFVAEADKNEVDWRLVVAITGVESTFGKHIPANSYNAYGWSNGLYQFSSWEESIAHVTKFLKERYLDRGLDTPQKIAPVYAPPSKTWGGNVAFFINKLENFQLNPLTNLELTL